MVARRKKPPALCPDCEAEVSHRGHYCKQCRAERTAEYIPTAEQIAESAAEIRDGWSAWEEKRRRGAHRRFEFLPLRIVWLN